MRAEGNSNRSSSSFYVDISCINCVSSHSKLLSIVPEVGNHQPDLLVCESGRGQKGDRVPQQETEPDPELLALLRHATQPLQQEGVMAEGHLGVRWRDGGRHL